MEKSKVELVYLSPEEIQQKKENGETILELSAGIKSAIKSRFYSGANGTHPLGQVPNAIVLSNQ